MHFTEINKIAEKLDSPFHREDFSVFGEHPYLMIDLEAVSLIKDSREYMRLCEKLTRVACPTIGITKEDSHSETASLAAALDVVVPTKETAAPVIRNILKAPLAAMTLVQLLRHSEGQDVHQGLFSESLAYATLQAGREFQTFLAKRHTSQTPKELVAGDTTDQNSKPCVIAQRQNNELWLTLNRPETLNAYSISMRDQLIEGLNLLAADTSITKAIIRGAGSCFCVGGDLTEFGQFGDTATAHAIRTARSAGKLISELAPRIECHVHRACIGSGIELPAFCNKIIASKETFFQLPEITMGLIPGAGGTVSIAKRIGRQRTSYFALSAKKINATTALEWGLIDAIREEL